MLDQKKFVSEKSSVTNVKEHLQSRITRMFWRVKNFLRLSRRFVSSFQQNNNCRTEWVCIDMAIISIIVCIWFFYIEKRLALRYVKLLRALLNMIILNRIVRVKEMFWKYFFSFMWWWRLGSRRHKIERPESFGFWNAVLLRILKIFLSSFHKHAFFNSRALLNFL